jgi:hypothetical protein
LEQAHNRELFGGFSMTSKERVKRAVEFRTPDKLPVEFNFHGMSDIVYLGLKQIKVGDVKKKRDNDDWGCTWERVDEKNMGQIKGHPLDSWEKLSSYTFPDPDSPAYYQGLDEEIKKADPGKYIRLEIFMVFFERLQGLRGFENVMYDFYDDRDKLEYLADKITEIDLAWLHNIKKRFPDSIDGIFFGDDLGTERDSFISKELFDEFFVPRYKKIFGAVHDSGWHVWLHSCGNITKLVPSLIESGVDVLNLQQPRVLDIKKFGELFAGKVCFSPSVDIQHTLPLKSAVEIEEEVELLIKYWSTPQGGLIPFEYFRGGAEMDIPPASDKAMVDAFLKHDPYKR